MTLVQTKPNVTFLLLQQNFQLKFSFKSYFFSKKNFYYQVDLHSRCYSQTSY